MRLSAKIFREEVFLARQERLYGAVVFSRSALSRLVLLGLVATVTLTLFLLSWSHYARIESVEGMLVTKTPSAKVVAIVPGVITRLDVAEGDHVRKGQTVAVITLEQQDLTGRGFATAGAAAVDARIVHTSEQLKLAREAEGSETERLRKTIATANASVAVLDTEIALQRQIVSSQSASYDQIQPVVQRGYVSRTESERRRQVMLTSRQNLATLEQQRLQALAAVDQARSELRKVAIDSDRSISELKSGIEGFSEQAEEIRQQQAYRIIAPVDGEVSALQVAQGRTAVTGMPLMTIVPTGSALEADLYAPSRAIGFVRRGQEARIAYDAFPYQRFGSFPSRVVAVSRIVIDPRESDVPLKLEGPVYRIRVRPDQQTIHAFGNDYPLQPGMTLRANIVLERQSLLDWLLAPVRAVLNRS
jgi:membrane fusion protein